MKKELILKLVEMLVSGDETQEAEVKSEKQDHHPLKGEMVIVRAKDAGVHFGELVSVSGRCVTLNKSRRMYQWWSAKEMTLSAVALYGLNLDKPLKICAELNNHTILDACEIIKASSDCVNSFDKTGNYNEQ